MYIRSFEIDVHEIIIFYAFSFIFKGAATSGQQQAHSGAAASNPPTVPSLVPTTATTPLPLSPVPAAPEPTLPAVQPTVAPAHSSPLTKNTPKNPSNPVSVQAPPIASAAKLPDGLGASASESSMTSDGAGSGPSNFAVGDQVRVQLEEEIVKMMQEGHGGWQDDMVEVREYYMYGCSST